jgi:SAM-dependent methyltransferase
MSSGEDISALLDQASAYYRNAGRFAWHFARGKISADPAFRGMLRLGLLEGRERLLDLGCGQGLLPAWLLAAQGTYTASRARWPQGWPAPPRFASYTGIELGGPDVTRARSAFAEMTGAQLEVRKADIAQAPFPAADAVVIMDVLHFLDYPSQDDVIRRVRKALPTGGLLMMRIGDAAGGLGFRLSKVTDQTVAFCRSGTWTRLHCRTLAQWQALLAQHQFSTRTLPMNEGTPFPNTLILGHAE